MGLLDTISDALPNFLPDDAQKREAAKMGLLNLGAAMLGANTGNFGRALGAGIGAGAQGYRQSYQDQMTQQLQNAQLLGLNLTNQKSQTVLKNAQDPTLWGGTQAPSVSSVLQQGAQAGSVGPTVANAARMDAAQVPSGTPGGAMNPLGMPTSLARNLYLTDPTGYAKNFIAPAYAPTDAQKALRAAGIDPNSPEGQQTLRGAVQKQSYIAPVSGRPGGYLQYPDGRTVQLPHVPDGFTAVQGQDGQWQIVPVKGGTEAMAASAAAVAGGKAQYKPVQVFNPQTGQMEYRSEAQVVSSPAPQGGQQGFPTVWPQEQQARDAARRQILQDELSKETDPGNRAALQREIDRMQPSGSAYAAAPPIGAIANADATAKGKVAYMTDSFKNIAGFRTVGNMATEDIDNMMKLGNGKLASTAGPFMAGAAGLFGANAAEYEKARDNLIATFSNQLGMTTDAARALVQGAIPDYGKPKAAIQAGLQTLRNQVTQRMVKASYLQGPYSSGDANAYAKAEGEFDQHISPTIAGIVTMPQGPQRTAAIKAAIANPQQRASLQWALDHGILK